MKPNSNLRNIRVVLALVILSAIFPSCKSDSKKLKQEIEHLEKTVMAIHDEVMPKMGMVISLRTEINAKADSSRDAGLKDSLQRVAGQLSKSDADMMGWMHQYQKPAVHDTSVYYLQYQLFLISRLRDEINASITNAKLITSPH